MFKPSYISTPEDIASLKKRQRAILSSALVSCQLWRRDDDDGKASEMDEEFQLQPLRSTRPGIGISTTEEALRCYISRDVLYELSRTGAILSLAIDAWLEWGKKHKRDNILLFGGGLEHSDVSTSIDIMVFDSGALKRISQVAIHGKNSSIYPDELADLIQREVQADSQTEREIHIAEGLLPEGGLERIAFRKIPRSHVDRPRLSPVSYGFQNVSVGDFVMPLMLVVAGAAFGVSQVMLERNRLEAAKTEFSAQVATVGEAYASGEAVLTMLQAKQAFMDRPPVAARSIEQLERLFAAIASVEGVAITGVAIPSADERFAGLLREAPDISEDAEFFMQVAIREDERRSPVVQSEPVLRAISQTIGGSLRLKEVQGQSQVVDTVRIRGLNIEGKFPPPASDEGQ